MNASRIGIKLFLNDPSSLHVEDLVNVFHSWIQQQILPGNLLIDVADYLHVPEGPGLVLVGHEANFAIDQADGHTGLYYLRKRPSEGSFEQKLSAAFQQALSAAWLLEQEPSLGGKWKFNSRRIHVRIADLLSAPNDRETFESLAPVFQSFFERLLGTPAFKIHSIGDPVGCFEIGVESAQTQDVGVLLARLQD